MYFVFYELKQPNQICPSLIFGNVLAISGFPGHLHE